MPAPRALVAALLLLAALLVDLTVLASLPLPGGPPHLALVVLACAALAEGPGAGLVLGFGLGLVSDLLSDHAAGRLALVSCAVGYVVGLVREESRRSAVATLGVVAAACAGVLLLDAGLGLVLGDPRILTGVVFRRTGGALLYAVVLGPFVFPAVRALLGRVARDRPA